MKNPSCRRGPSLRPFLLILLLSDNTMRNGVIGFLLPNIAQCFRPVVRTVRPFSLPARGASVTGTVYKAIDKDAPVVTLFTKEGCTLCDKVKDVLVDLRESHDHALTQIDITDDAHSEWYDKYKYDIPVLHLNSKYWIKHRLTTEEALEGFLAFKDGRFVSPLGEPNASEMERT